MIKFHYTYIIMAIGFILTGYYQNLIAFTSLIIFHELGHYLVAMLLHFNVKKIIIYPYGGLTKIEDLINKDINKELLIAVSGIIFQIIFYLIILKLYEFGVLRYYTYNLFKLYNNRLIFFNLLPIYPLDGAKILNLILNKYIPYLSSNKVTLYISVISLIFILSLNIYKNNYSYIMIMAILLNYIYMFYKELDYLFNKFLLERYLYKISYQDKKIVSSPKKMYKNRSHIIKNHQKYQKESDFLNNLFDLHRKI